MTFSLFYLFDTTFVLWNSCIDDIFVNNNHRYTLNWRSFLRIICFCKLHRSLVKVLRFCTANCVKFSTKKGDEYIRFLSSFTYDGKHDHNYDHISKMAINDHTSKINVFIGTPNFWIISLAPLSDNLEIILLVKIISRILCWSRHFFIFFQNCGIFRKELIYDK